MMVETTNGAATLGTRVAGNGTSLLLRGVKKAFADVKAVDGVDLEVARGECFGLLGPNGAGKTTTIEICEGLTTPDAGTVELLGLKWGANANELRQRIGIQLQETQFPEKLTVEETLRLFRSFFKRGISVEESIKTAQLEEKRGARVGGLSGGQKQRLAMATALVGDPELLFLDEPTTGLDPQARRHLWDLVDDLKHAGRTIILTTHYMDEAERLCDRVAIMDHGNVIALGTPNELIASIGGEDIVEFAVVESIDSPVPKGEGPATSGGVIGSPVPKGEGSPPHGPGPVRGDPGPGAPSSVGGSPVPTVSSPHGRVDAGMLLGIPGVKSHRVDAGLHQLAVSETHTVVPRIFTALTEHGLHLSEFRTHSATLEDVFVRLTGRNLRDE
jgi:ABC-2 type transport system ATP-binding protein